MNSYCHVANNGVDADVVSRRQTAAGEMHLVHYSGRGGLSAALSGSCRPHPSEALIAIALA
jgi:hypothetical protein